MARKYRLPDVDAVRGCCVGVPEAQAVIVEHYRNYLRVCLRSMAASFLTEINQYDLEDLEQKILIENLDVMRSFVPYPEYSNDEHIQLD